MYMRGVCVYEGCMCIRGVYVYMRGVCEGVYNTYSFDRSA